MSTSMLVEKMKQAAKDKKIEIEIRATANRDFKGYADQTDILLLGPQVSYMLDELKTKYEPKGIKVDVINTMDYGMMNGEKVLLEAINA